MQQVHEQKGETWPKILKYNCDKYGDRRRAMRYKRYGVWQPYTWMDYYLDVKYLALGLLTLGFKVGDKLLIVGDNAPQWYCAELAAQANHGASVGVYPELTPSEISYIARNSEARFAIVEDQEQVDKFLQIKDELPLLEKVIYWSYKGLAHYQDPLLTGYNQVLDLGSRHEEEHPGLFEQNVETGQADDVCAVVYTSGTTGAAPKGAVHTYGSMRSSVDHILRLAPWHEDDNVVPHLPPAWMTEQWFGIGCHLLSANIQNFAEAPETQQRDTRETRPSIVFYGARLWESQASMVQARMLNAHTINRLAFRLLMPVGYKMADLRLQHKGPSLPWKILGYLADVALFRPIRASLGLSHARICYTAGAILSPDAFRFYHALNLPLRSLYGSTEGGAVAGAKNEEIRLDSVGPVHEGKGIRITDQGEIVCRQPGIFVGYYGDPGKTAEVLRDGWFHSGDNGFVREDGHLVFVDRANDLVELPTGDKLAPQFIESRLRFSPYIKDAWVLAGPEKAYVSAIVIINYEPVSRWAGQRKVAHSGFTDLSQTPEVYALVKEDIERLNRTLSSGLKIRKYVNLHREFSHDEGELTVNRRLRRAFLGEHYGELIRAIYGDKTEVLMEARMTHQDGRMGTMRTTLRIDCLGRAAS